MQYKIDRKFCLKVTKLFKQHEKKKLQMVEKQIFKVIPIIKKVKIYDKAVDNYADLCYPSYRMVMVVVA